MIGMRVGLIQIDNLGVPRVGILNTFAGEYSDSVRFDYRVGFFPI